MSALPFHDPPPPCDAPCHSRWSNPTPFFWKFLIRPNFPRSFWTRCGAVFYKDRDLFDGFRLFFGRRGVPTPSFIFPKKVPPPPTIRSSLYSSAPLQSGLKFELLCDLLSWRLFRRNTLPFHLIRPPGITSVFTSSRSPFLSHSNRLQGNLFFSLQWSESFSFIPNQALSHALKGRGNTSFIME